MNEEYKNFCKEKEKFSQKVQVLKNLTPTPFSPKDEVDDWCLKVNNLRAQGGHLTVFWNDVRLPEK